MGFSLKSRGSRAARGLLLAACLCLPLLAQESMAPHKSFVTMAPQPLVAVTRGKPNMVDLQFRVEPGLHINSNKPSSQLLIPTVLRLDPPTDVMIGRISYPEGQQMSFVFSPDDNLSVYTGDFTVSVEVRPLAHVQPARYAVRGRLKYQACDNSACYPPKLLPVNFDIKVVKAPPPPRRNPAQSPHVHQ